MSDRCHRVCPVERAGTFDSRLRRWFQDPRKILGPYIEAGMTVVDLGCGPGFFSIEMARMVGPSGRVIAVDLQAGMLRKLSNKIKGTELEDRIALHECSADHIAVTGPVDFVLAFYMVHEVVDQGAFSGEIGSMLAPGGKLFIVEPTFHVSKKAFSEMVRKTRTAGFVIAERPKVFMGRSVLLTHSRA